MDGIGLLSAYGGAPVLRAAYEQSINPLFSFGITAEIGTYAISNIDQGSIYQETYSLHGYGIMGEFRCYPINTRRPAPSGFFIGTHIRGRILHEHYTAPRNVDIINRGGMVEFGLHTGYKFVIGQFIVEPLIGYGTGTVTGFDDVDRKSINPYFQWPIDRFANLFRAELYLGFVFPEIKRN